MNKYEEFVHRLSRGTTCCKFVTFVEEYKGYVIYHHKTHYEWVGTMEPYAICRAYIAFIKYDPTMRKFDWTDKFLDNVEFYLRKSRKSIDYIKSLIDEDIS